MLRKIKSNLQKINYKGMSLIEAIVAIAIFSMVASVIITMSVGGFNSINQGSDQATAETLVQEGMEAIKSIREGAWNELAYNLTSVSISNNEWVFDGEGASETIGKFNRKIILTEVCRDALDEITTCPGNYTDVNTKLVTVSVDWQTATKKTNSVEQSLYLTNWDSGDWSQTNWIGGDGQTVWSDATKYDSADINVNDEVDGEIKLKISESGECAGYTWHFNEPSDYVYNSEYIKVESSMAQLNPVGDDVIIGISDLPIDTYEFDTSQGLESDIIHVTGNIYAVVYRGANNDGFVRTVEIDNSGEITEPYIDSLEFDSSNTHNPKIIQVATDVYAIVYRGRSDDGYLVTVEIDNQGNISNSLLDSLEYNNRDSYEPQIIHVANDVYAIIYRHGWSGGAVRTVSIQNDGTIGNGYIDYYPYTLVGHYESDLIHAIDDIYLVAYRFKFCFLWWCWDTGELVTLEIQDNGSIVGEVDSYTYYNDTAYEPDITHVTNNIVAVAYRDSDNDGMVETFNIQNNGNISRSIDNFEFDTNNGYDPQITYLQDDYYGVVYHNGNGNGYVSIFGIESNGQIANDLLDTFEIDMDTGGDSLSMTNISDLIYGVSYDGPNEDGYITTIELVTSAALPTNGPNIYPVVSYQPPNIDDWTSLNETAFKDGGEIFYQISDDNGATWYWWDGNSWSEAINPTDYNTAFEVSKNLWQWNPTGDSFKFNAFLKSNGVQFVRLDSVSINCSNLQIEVGTVSTDENWVRVNLNNIYANPVIIATYNENNNSRPASVRINNVAASYFDIRLQNPGNRNLSVDEITYMVIEEGVWDIDGVTIEAHTYNTNTVGYDGDWNHDIQRYYSSFGTSPIVLHQVMSYNDPDWISTYVSHRSSRYNPPGLGSFRIAMNGGEATTTHGNETIGWVAIERAQIGTVENVDFETYRTNDFIRGHDNGCYDVYYQSNFSQVPLVISSQQQMDDTDGSWSVICDRTSSYVGFHSEEDQELNTERRHGTEVHAYVVFEEPFFYSSVGDAQAYEDNGVLISSAFDMGNSSKAIQTVKWSEVVPTADCPLCDVTMQIRTSDTQAGLSTAEWSGPTGAGDSFSDPYGELVNTNHNGNRWIQYKVNLFGDGDYTPTVRDIKINYK